MGSFLVVRVRYPIQIIFENPPQEFRSFCLINFDDIDAVANVMQNKDNIIIADCKFNVCEQKTSGKNEMDSKVVPVVTGVEKKPQNKTIQISNVQAQDLGGGAKSYENFETKTFVTLDENGNFRTEQRKNGNCTFQSDLMAVKKFFRLNFIETTRGPIFGPEKRLVPDFK